MVTFGPREPNPQSEKSDHEQQSGTPQDSVALVDADASAAIVAS